MADDQTYICPSCNFAMTRDDVNFVEPEWEARCPSCETSLAGIIPTIDLSELDA